MPCRACSAGDTKEYINITVHGIKDAWDCSGL